MKRAGHIIAILLTLCGLFSCTMQELVYPGYEGVPEDLIRELGLNEPEMPVRIGFDLPGEEVRTPETRASIIEGKENPSDFIRTLHMVCFTKEGIYLGWRKASLIGAEQAYNHVEPGTSNVLFSCQGRELFEGTVPARTARIHFVGNVGIGVDDDYAPSNIPGNDQIGGNENTLVKSSKMTVSAANDTICYWGFHGEPTSEAMKDWLALATTEPDGTTTYSKQPGHNVHMVRDRARVTFGYMFDFPRTSQDVEDGKKVEINGVEYTIQGGKITIGNRQYPIEKNATTYTIKEIYWILSNGLEKGYIAPYHDENSNDHFEGYFDLSSTPALKEDRLTQYDKADATRYKALDETEMMKVYDATTPITNPPSLFLFEDENKPDNPPKIILKVVYQESGQSGTKTKYHTLMMLNESQEPCKVYRNHNYTLDIYGLPWEGLGYADFIDAVNSVTYSNNQTVSISEEVPAVNDGRFQLSVDGSTSLIFQDPTLVNSSQTIRFSYKALVSSENTSEVTASDFKAAWDTDVLSSFAQSNVTVSQVSNDGTTFVGEIHFTLGTLINSTLQSGQIELRDTRTGMTRFINIYTITKFDYLPSGSSALQLIKTGESRPVNGEDCDTYKMDIKIPGDYPIGLYSINVRMTSTTLNPFKVERKSSGETTIENTDTDISVRMGATENGSTLDGEVLSGMSFTSNSQLWNYRAAGEPWNFWFIYTLINKPTVVENGETVEDERDKVYTIYFDDVRPLRAPENRPDNLGLFFKIKYFGPAVSVEYTP